MTAARILVVEDDRDLREALLDTLELADYDASAADCAEEAIKRLMLSHFDMVISDVNMPGMDGHDLLAHIKREHPQIPVLLMTAYGSVNRAVDAMKEGAVDYLLKPFEPKALLALLKRVLVGEAGSDADQPVAVEESSQQVLALARRVAASDATVLISGESGTGKEVLARYIHQNSGRAGKAFVAINCAAIPENMLEATLFGHEKGAFTGAYNSAPGKFELADGGTILLDEISEMDLGLQAKLLRVLQEREVERVGGRKTLSLDVRVIATTNRDMAGEVARGRFREDLYYRLCVFPVQWLPLRERTADIVPLARRLIQVHSDKMRKPAPQLDDSACTALLVHQWPGNVRELDNAVQRALILQQGSSITAADLCLPGQGGLVFPSPRVPVADMNPVNTSAAAFPSMPTAAPEPAVPVGDHQGVGLGEDMKSHEFQVILNVLRDQRGRRKEAAEILGISARTLRYKLAKMREAGFDPDSAIAC
ncbi:sigma-54-dependent transcriptional regulator [Aestuariirhabdus litorea]|uniref:Sigma-54-dependent Fis family transcriptional regulator n=1 Tax=Aestuariirhabdus litorea TaxID=2528527 RepID=A0A3P3VTJ8_9GAMM|nr:sigma-54 dependent transcriptional regulator [Aestuariirhabdus litorea]RRJ84996.1 sigma-54-dependent Fis family transcriptional regulator [Aestuariirhabdus litorea]RWW98221.1 response regulator [Endozoicomonadaceae bacterium GTF-13]